MKVLFSNNEGLVASDFNLQRDLYLKHLFDTIAMNQSQENAPWMPVRTSTTRLRPYGYSGMIKRLSTTQIRVAGGQWLWCDFSASPSSTAPIAIVGNLDAYQDLTVTGFAGLGGNARRDIIQARLTFVNASATSRNFRDPNTGALTSSSIVKQSTATVEYAIKQGTAGGFLVAEPTPDAGWFKIGSVLVRSTGIDNEDEIFDWREPIGDYVFQQIAPSMWTASSSDWFITSNGSRQSNTVAGGELFATLQMPTPLAGTSGDRMLATRIRKVSLDCDYGTTNPTASQIKFRRVASGAATPSSGNVSSGTGIWDGNVGTLVTVSTRTQVTLYDGSTAYFPLWSNGKHSPYILNDATLGPPMVGVKFIGANTDDLIYGVTWDIQGGR